MCCCKKDLPHTETMKFTMRFSKHFNEDVLNEKIFHGRGLGGELNDLDQTQEKKITIPTVNNKMKIFGRNI